MEQQPQHNGNITIHYHTECVISSALHEAGKIISRGSEALKISRNRPSICDWGPHSQSTHYKTQCMLREKKTAHVI